MKVVTESQWIHIGGGESESFEWPLSNEVMIGGAMGLVSGLVLAGVSNINSFVSVVGGTLVGGCVGHVYQNTNNDEEHFSLKIDI